MYIGACAIVYALDHSSFLPN